MISVRFGARRSGGPDASDIGNSHRIYVQAMRAAQAARAAAARPSEDEAGAAIRLEGWLRACMGCLRRP